MFGFLALQAVILNKEMSLIVVLTALPARLISVPYSDLAPYWFVVVNLLAGNLVGAWIGATRIPGCGRAPSNEVIAVLLVFIAAALAVTHLTAVGTLDLTPALRTVVVSRPASASRSPAACHWLAISLPTMLFAFARFSRDNSFQALRDNRTFVVVMALGSIAGTLIGGIFLGSSPRLS